MRKNVSEKHFFELCGNYAKQKAALDVVNFANKHIMTCELITRLIGFEFVYYKKSIFPARKRSLTCRVYMRKNSPLYFLLPDLIPFFSDSDFRSTIFENVCTDNFEACMHRLFEILDEYLPRFEESYDDHRYTHAYDEMIGDYKKLYKLKDDDFDFSNICNLEDEDIIKFLGMQLARERFMICKYTQGAEYGHFILGNTAEAIAAYEKIGKKGNLLAYDEKLLAFLKTPAAKGYQPLPRSCMSKGERSGYGRASSLKEAKTLAKHTLLFFVPLSILFCSVMAIIQYSLTAGTLIDAGPVWLFGIACAFLSSIFLGMSLRRVLIKRLDKENAEKHLMMDELINPPALNVAINIACGFFVMLSLFCVAAFSSTCPAVYEDKVSYSEVPFVYEDYYYKDVENVYYIESRYNGFGEIVDYPSYVLVMKDGRGFDFYWTEFDNEDVEKTVVPILKTYGLEPIVVETDRDLPIEIH